MATNENRLEATTCWHFNTCVRDDLLVLSIPVQRLGVRLEFSTISPGVAFESYTKLPVDTSISSTEN